MEEEGEEEEEEELSVADWVGLAFNLLCFYRFCRRAPPRFPLNAKVENFKWHKGESSIH